MTSDSPAWPHGELQQAFPDVFFVVGTNKTHHEGVDFQTSRTMTVVRHDGALTLLNTVRLDDEGLRQLDALGQVRHVVRLGAFHGRDDAFYTRRYRADFWALPGVAPSEAPIAVRTLSAGGEFPLPDGEAFVFASARFPEAAVWLRREGGVLITCDAIQNWTHVDRFFSPECGAMFQAQGLIGAANIPATWLAACEPGVDDFRRLLALPFRHLISAHGEPLLDEAHERVEARAAATFAL